MAGRLWLVGIALRLVLVSTGAGAQPAATTTLLTQQFRFTDADILRLRTGDAIARQVAVTAPHEVVVVGAIRIGVPADVLIARLRDIEHFERGRGFLATRKLSEPPRLDDFSDLQLPRNDLAALRTCRPGRCEVKFGQGAFDQLSAFDWRAPDPMGRAHALVRRTALAYVEAYRAGGNEALPVFLDKPAPMTAAKEFGALVARARVLLDRAPGLADRLERYPTHGLPDAEEFFYWSVADFGLKPLFRINHVVIARADAPDGTRFVAATKQLYATHYFYTALEVRVVIADAERPDSGLYLVTMTLARADGFTGLFGSLVRSKVRAASLDGMLRSLRATKRRIEGAPRQAVPD